MSIEIVRLTTGEELLCEVKKSNGGYQLTDVTIIVPTQEKSIAVMPFMPYSTAAKDGIFMPNDSVMFTVTPQAELVNHHKEIHSKIVLPNSGIVTN
jgi:hypothetical protein